MASLHSNSSIKRLDAELDAQVAAHSACHTIRSSSTKRATSLPQRCRACSRATRGAGSACGPKRSVSDERRGSADASDESVAKVDAQEGEELRRAGVLSESQRVWAHTITLERVIRPAVRRLRQGGERGGVDGVAKAVAMAIERLL